PLEPKGQDHRVEVRVPQGNRDPPSWPLGNDRFAPGRGHRIRYASVAGRVPLDFDGRWRPPLLGESRCPRRPALCYATGRRMTPEPRRRTLKWAGGHMSRFSPLSEEWPQPQRRVGTRVIVMGGSLGGLNAALWLRYAGCDVDVYERSPSPMEGRGWYRLAPS